MADFCDNAPITERQLTELTKPTPSRPYEAYATIAGRDDDGPYIAMVLVHPDSGSADDNVELLQGRIEGSISTFYKTPRADEVDGTEIMSKGQLLLAEIRGYIAKYPTTWVSLNDNLMLHECPPNPSTLDYCGYPTATMGGVVIIMDAGDRSHGRRCER